MDRPGHHPYFNDQRTTFWHTRLEEAMQAARDEGKAIFVQVGRPLCGGSRALVEKTLPKEEIGEFLRQHFVCLAVHADEPGPEVAALVARLPRQQPTPLCIYLGADGQPVHSTAGGRPPAVLLQDMTEAVNKLIAR